MSAFPPQRTITSIPVSRLTALTYLSAYLTCSETQPHLLPNTHLDPSGGPTIGSSKHSVTIHNLKRMEAGLRGEWLAPSLQLGNDDMITSPSRLNQGSKKTDENNHDVMEMDDSKIFEGSDALELMEEHVEDSQGFITSPRNHPKLVSESNANSRILSPRNNTNELNKEARKAEKKARRKLHKKTVQNSAQE